MSRIEDNKLLKRTNLMETAFQLFTSQGIAKTSIADIAQRSGVAKGTFYLYFKDKYDLHEKLVIDKSEQLFRHALEHSGYQSRKGSADKLTAIIDDVLYLLQKDPLLLQFINKNLSWGVFRRALDQWQPDYAAIFEEVLGTSPTDRKTLEIEVYTILELVGSTCHSVILNKDPTDLWTYLPYLHCAIRAILSSFETVS